MPLRSYVYISKTKVDSLYEQIPSKQLRQLAKKLTIDLKIIKAEFGAEEREESLVARTQIVERYLDHEGVVADVDAAGKDDEIEFFRGRLPLTWSAGRYGGLVYFSGRTDETVLVLGGSGRHQVSNAGAFGIGEPHGGYTSTPGLIEGMKLHYFAEVDGPRTSESAQTDEVVDPLPVGAPLPSNSLATLVAHTYVDALGSMPETRMAFLAVPMAIEPLTPASLLLTSDEALLRGAANALLASPLYVSLKH
jgi:hypothetical protein